MWSAARFLLRLSDAEFFALTPRQFNLLIARRNEQTEHDELMFAQLAQAVLAPHTEKLPALDSFMPSRWKPKVMTPEESQAEQRQRTAKKIASLFDAHNKQFLNG